MWRLSNSPSVDNQHAEACVANLRTRQLTRPIGSCLSFNFLCPHVAVVGYARRLLVLLSMFHPYVPQYWNQHNASTRDFSSTVLRRPRRESIEMTRVPCVGAHVEARLRNAQTYSQTY
ncbi:hypothetical protein EJ02DRAFT_197657 [Clathrospora elynae]|uniref:Uncharacterized protein n=1 Tax=Clathrospora elynae TaxID=706981 RepID=A0A6A5T4L2_9PLEO|nr:hypothetical protein EJ02DRAFT_197657 [Clathrospora elynae]